MIPWDKNDKGLYEWAVQRLAREELLAQKEEFAAKFPSDELKHIYAVLDEQVVPLLATNGIPMTREEAHDVFLSWFVKRESPAVKCSQASPDNEDGIRGLEPISKLNLIVISSCLRR